MVDIDTDAPVREPEETDHPPPDDDTDVPIDTAGGPEVKAVDELLTELEGER